MSVRPQGLPSILRRVRRTAMPQSVTTPLSDRGFFRCSARRSPMRFPAATMVSARSRYLRASPATTPLMGAGVLIAPTITLTRRRQPASWCISLHEPSPAMPPSVPTGSSRSRPCEAPISPTRMMRPASPASNNAGSFGTFNEFTGNGGDDNLTGNGNTRISFTNATAGVTVDLAAGISFSTASGDIASVGTDHFTGVNAVQASMFADSLSGDANNNTFAGLGGNDFIDGR